MSFSTESHNGFKVVRLPLLAFQRVRDSIDPSYRRSMRLPSGEENVLLGGQTFGTIFAVEGALPKTGVALALAVCPKCGRSFTAQAKTFIPPDQPGGDKSDDGDELTADVIVCGVDGEKMLLPVLAESEA